MQFSKPQQIVQDVRDGIRTELTAEQAITAVRARIDSAIGNDDIDESDADELRSAVYDILDILNCVK